MNDSAADRIDFRFRLSRLFSLTWTVAGRLTAVAGGLAVLYVLSIGPVGAVAKKWSTGSTDKQKNDVYRDLRLFYRPVIWMHDNTILKKPLYWYVDLWDAN